MTGSRPLVSVVVTCYNQRRYILEALDSVLSQSYDNLELIVVDDGSSDGTSTVVQSVKDSRLTYIWQPNQGPSAATNRGLKRAKGEFIALMGGDDVCFKDRLSIQLDQINFGNDVVFSLPKLINDQSQNLPYYHYPAFFRDNFSTTSDLFRILFFEFNFLCGPTAFAKRRFFEQVGMYRLGLIQLQDFDLWVRACRSGTKIARFAEPVVSYRIRNDGGNLSSTKFIPRISVEMKMIYTDFFENAPLPLLKSAFPQEIGVDAKERDLSVEVDLLLLLLSHPSHLVKSAAVEKIITAMDSQEYLEHFQSRGLGLPEFFRLTSEISPYVL